MSLNLYDYDQDGLADLLEEQGLPRFRAKQLYHQLYVKQQVDFEHMTDLPAGLRQDLASRYCIGNLERTQVFEGDEGLTRKALFDLGNNIIIEAVLMVYPDRATVCVSSQAGCPMQCSFCATGKLGLLKNLSSGQIIEQVLWAAREVHQMREAYGNRTSNRHKVTAQNFPHRLTNVVFMGMGEPFNNMKQWYASVERLHDPKGFNMGARSFTVSTVGLVPGIQKLAEANIPINLAVSLHTPDDERRTRMMPVNKKYNVGILMQAVRDYIAKTNRRVSLEYILLEGETDTPDQADSLARLINEPERALCHVNLIPWNPVPGTDLARSQRDRVNAFRDRLVKAHVPCTIRIHRGMDIDAACGQLAGQYQDAHKGVEVTP